MKRVWQTATEAYLCFTQALAIVENQMEKMGGHVEKLDELSLGPEASVRATVSLYFNGPELREYTSRLPQRVSDTAQG
jgi:hypothetical protein